MAVKDTSSLYPKLGQDGHILSDPNFHIASVSENRSFPLASPAPAVIQKLSV